MPDVFFNGGVMHVGGDFKPGDQAPSGYLDWHEWAEVQHKAGLRQKECGRCSRWKYPQELSELIDRTTMQSRRGPVVLSTAVCNNCATQATQADSTSESTTPGALNRSDANRISPVPPA